ncbi:MAG: TetR/AcrR family transcriptional regulator [Rikenellaceae bacterium]
MQTQKDIVREQILSVVCKLFLRRGFSGVSMRDISKDSGVGLSNIYNYFKNKNDIFGAIVKPALDKLFTAGDKYHAEEIEDIMVLTNKEHHQSIIGDYLAHIIKYRVPYKLLFTCSQGSAYANFKDKYCDEMMRDGKEFFVELKRRYPDVKCDFSDTFLRLLTLTNLSLYELCE